MIRLALADDQLLFRRGMVMLLRDMAGVQVLFECGNGEELLTGLRNNDVDIVLLDLQMPVMDGMDTLPRVKREHPEVKVIVLSTHEEEKFIAHAMDLGANGYMLKSADTDEIENAIRSVYHSGYYYSDRVSRVMLHGLVKKQKVKPNFNELDPLSERELEVLRGICQELTNTEIAGKLFISPRTVEGHRNNMLLKTGAKNTAGLVVYAMTKGYYTPQ
ncbi:MAG: response regulator transcription factor [Flavobacteriales bacterium]